MILSLLAAGALLRAAITFQLKAIWCDEWGSIILARYGWAELITRAAADIHPPLYFLSLAASIRALGENEWAFRLPSLAGSLIALPFLYLAAKRLFDRRVAVWTLFFAAGSPYLIHLSREIRHHGLPAAFTAAMVYGYFSALKRPRRPTAYLFLASTAALVYTHHYGWFAVAAVAAHYLWGVLKKKPEHRKIGWLMLSAWALAAPAAGLLAFHLSNGEALTDPVTSPRVLLTVAKQSAVVYWHIVCGPRYFMNYTELVLGYMRSSPLFWAHAALFAAVLSLAGAELTRLWRGDRRAAFFWTALTVLPVLVTALANPIRLETRYFAFMAGFVWMLAARSFVRLKRPARIVLTTLALLVAAHNFIFMSRLATDAYHHSDFIALSRFTAREAGARDAIVGDMQDQYLFYDRTLGLGSKAPYFRNAWDLTRKNSSAIEKIYYLGGFWEEDGASDLIIEHLRALGFERDGRQLVFGDGPFVSMLNIFSRVSQS